MKLLIEEPPLQVLPSLAKEIGLNEALILQQIHYWLLKSDKDIDGRTWTYNSYPDWQKQFPFFSTKTIQRTFKSLEDKGLVITGNYNKMTIDRTKWYSIDYEALSKFEQCVLTNRTSCPYQNPNKSSPIPETNTEINTNIYSVFDFWNTKRIVMHRKMTESVKGHISASLKSYKVEEVMTAIENYNTILNGDEYYWTHKWTLSEFLVRGLDKFVDDNEPLNSFLKVQKQSQAKKPRQSLEDKLNLLKEM